jgi:hypothetical protein
MSKHTPGPWKVVDRWLVDDSASTRWAIEQVESTQPFVIGFAVSEVDARRMAASPDLLEAALRGSCGWRSDDKRTA